MRRYKEQASIIYLFSLYLKLTYPSLQLKPTNKNTHLCRYKLISLKKNIMNNYSLYTYTHQRCTQNPFKHPRWNLLSE